MTTSSDVPNFAVPEWAVLEPDGATLLDQIRLLGKALDLLATLARVEPRDLLAADVDSPRLDEVAEGLAAVVQANEYLDVALSSRETARSRSMKFAKAVAAARTEHSREALEKVQQLLPEQNAGGIDLLEMTAPELMERRAELRRLLDGCSDPLERSSLEIRLGDVDLAEGLLKIREGNNSMLDAHRVMTELEDSFTADLTMFWDRIADQLAVAQRRQDRLRRWRHRLRRGRFLAYASVWVLAGVGADRAVGETPLNSFTISATLAVALWALDKCVISPRLERQERVRQLMRLAGDVWLCSQLLVQIRELEGSMRAVGRPLGVTSVALLDPVLFADVAAELH